MVVEYLYSQHDKGWAYINANEKLSHSMNIEHTRELSTLLTVCSHFFFVFKLTFFLFSFAAMCS